MQSPWRDPPEREDPPNRVTGFLVYFIAALIGTFMIVNLVRGILGMGWNW